MGFLKLTTLGTASHQPICRSLSAEMLRRRHGNINENPRKMKNHKLWLPYFYGRYLCEWECIDYYTVGYFAFDLFCFRLVGGGIFVCFIHPVDLLFEVTFTLAGVAGFVSLNTQVFDNIIMEQIIFNIRHLVSADIQYHDCQHCYRIKLCMSHFFVMENNHIVSCSLFYILENITPTHIIAKNPIIARVQPAKKIVSLRLRFVFRNG